LILFTENSPLSGMLVRGFSYLKAMQIDQARDIRKGETLDQNQLNRYLQTNLENFGPITAIKQFPGGYSNLTYLVQTPGQEYVLRRPPFGANIKSAHDMGREFRVLSLLQGYYQAAPKPLIHCEDEVVIGAPFYMMERVKGVIMRPSNPPRPLPSSKMMRRISEAAIDNFVVLHGFDLETTGLKDLGRPEGYTQRQVEGWTRRYERAKTDELREMQEIAEYLLAEIPADPPPSFIHNDYKYDNIVLDPEQLDHILAVLDWEMATVGNPLMDLGTSLSYWVEPKDHPALHMFNLTALPGNLNRLEVVERYEEKSGRSTGKVGYYFIYGCYKLAVIIQQIYARYVKGYTQDKRFAELGEVVRACATQGSKALQHQRIYDLN
jgi:aminoglycoside phosphotransferase (APT) family kinase protein